MSTEDEQKSMNKWVEPNYAMMKCDLTTLSQDEMDAWHVLQENMNRWFDEGDAGETEEQALWRKVVRDSRIIWMSFLDRSLEPLAAAVRKNQWEKVPEVLFYCPYPVVSIPTLRQCSSLSPSEAPHEGAMEEDA